jgi:hypothetical protein
MTNAPIVCPCCPLHCDDLDRGKFLAGQTGCGIADKHVPSVLRLERASKIGPIDWETCRRWVSEAKQIIVSGHVIDLETSRAISEFASHTGAKVTAQGSNPSALAVLAREGAYLTTLGELSSAETSLMVIGDVASHWPRIEERLGAYRRVVRWADSDDLPERIAALRAALKGVDVPRQAENQWLTEAVSFVNTSTYLVLLVTPLAESKSCSPIIWSSLLGMVRERNKSSRAAILGFDISTTLRSVMASRLDPLPQLSTSDDTSLRIIFSPFGEDFPDLPNSTVVIGMAKKNLKSNQRLLPARVPGIHQSGIVIRGDGSVTLPLLSCSDATNWTDCPATQLRRLFA